MLHVLLFVSILSLGFVLTIFSNPAVSFVLYEIVYFFSPLERWWASYLPDVSYSFFTVVLMFFALLIKRRPDSKNSVLAAPPFKWMYALLLLYGIAWFYAVIPDGHQTALINYLKLVIIVSIAYKLIDSSRNLDYALWGYIFGSWYISFLIYQTGRNSFNRVEGIGTVDSPDANGIAAAIAPSLVICLYYFWITQRKLLKVLFAFAGVFIANAIILINSRGSFLGVAISLVFFMYYLFFSSYRRRYQIAVAISLTVAGLSGMFYLADETFFERVETMRETEVNLEQQQAATTRFVFWSSALDLAKDRPFGSGYQGFDYFAPIYLPQNLNTGFSRNRSVHSTWFEALTEIGYLGFMLLILLVYSSYSCLRTCMRRLRQHDDFDNYFKMIALQAALLSFVVCMTFLNRFRAEIFYWLILYSACAYNIYVTQASNAKHTV